MDDSTLFSQIRRRIRATKHILLTGLSVLSSFQKGLFAVALLLFIAASFGILAKWNATYMVEVPRQGGMLVEGIIDFPRFVNPIIAKSDADRDMTALVYSGLLRATEDGSLIPDLAESYTVDESGESYTFILRPNAIWHDGEPVMSEDVAFTIDKVRDNRLAIKSPRRASWEGVTVETPDARTVIFRLKQPYAPFLENATMGIIPKHIWKNVPDEEFDVTYYNVEPIGSGPYRIEHLVRDKKGLPSYYDLAAFPNYTLGEPYIARLRMMFFGNNNELLAAYTEHTIDQMHGLLPSEAMTLAAEGATIKTAPLPRIFALYLNQTEQPIFANKSVRQALDMSVDRNRIVSEALHGYARAINGPLPFGTTEGTADGKTTGERIADARLLLEKDGWKQNPETGRYEKTQKGNKAKKEKDKTTTLSFSIAMPDVPELRQAGEIMKSNWEELGASVTLKVFEPSSFSSDVLTPRKYEALFFGQIVGRVPDPYPYWHSSQKNAPGLNVAEYGNKTVDKLLEDIRKENDLSKRNELLGKFSDAIQNDIPAIFLYSPDFLYATKDGLRGMKTGLITTESERFLDIANWYTESERVWKFFADRTPH